MKQTNIKPLLIAFGMILCAFVTFGQKLTLNKQEFELKNVMGAITELNGEKVLKIERDLKALSFDVKNLEATVDEPTYAKVTNLDFENGVIEVKIAKPDSRSITFSICTRIYRRSF
jgi:hypothetical protein